MPKVNLPWIKIIRDTLGKHDLDLINTKHQFIVIFSKTFGQRTIETKIKLNGRLISQTFDLGQDKNMAIISIYGVTGNKHGTYADGTSKDYVRSQLFVECRREIKRIEANYKNPDIIVMGDLQETITQTKADNIGTNTHKQLPNGMVNLLTTQNHNMTPILFNARGDKQYITHIPKGRCDSGRGISHIFLNPRCAAKFLGGSIDKIPTTCTGNTSDHYLIYADIHTGYKHQNMRNKCENEKEAFLFGTISRIKVKQNYDTKKEYIHIPLTKLNL